MHQDTSRFLGRPVVQMALDYGGSFVVNLARRSISPRQFGTDKETGEMKSVLFQKAVCFIHANAGGFADAQPDNDKIVLEVLMTCLNSRAY